MIQSTYFSVPLPLNYRLDLEEAMRLVVVERKTVEVAIEEMGMKEATAPDFKARLLHELNKVEDFNCARFRLRLSTVRAWIAKGRTD